MEDRGEGRVDRAAAGGDGQHEQAVHWLTTHVRTSRKVGLAGSTSRTASVLWARPLSATSPA
ncbi:MAG: hypothetical protein ACK559_07640 [bacterium]